MTSLGPCIPLRGFGRNVQVQWLLVGKGVPGAAPVMRVKTRDKRWLHLPTAPMSVQAGISDSGSYKSGKENLPSRKDFFKWITILSTFYNVSSLWTAPFWMKWKHKRQMGLTWSQRAKWSTEIFIDLLSAFSDRPSSNQSGWEMESISQVVKHPWSLQVTAEYLPLSTNIKSSSQDRKRQWGEHTHITRETQTVIA